MAHRHPIFGLIVVALLCFGATPSAAQSPDVIGQWSRVASLPYFPVHTHLLPTGKVMIWPGSGVHHPEGLTGNDPPSWDPADPFNVDPSNAGSAAHVATLSTPGYDIFCTGHSFLADGRLFVAGGHIELNVGLSGASTYNPFSGATGAWSNLPNMNDGRWYPTTTVLANGDVLVVSGDIDLTVGVNMEAPGVPAKRNASLVAESHQRAARAGPLPHDAAGAERPSVQCSTDGDDPLSRYVGDRRLELGRDSGRRGA